MRLLGGVRAAIIVVMLAALATLMFAIWVRMPQAMPFGWRVDLTDYRVGVIRVTELEAADLRTICGHVAHSQLHACTLRREESAEVYLLKGMGDVERACYLAHEAVHAAGLGHVGDNSECGLYGNRR